MSGCYVVIGGYGVTMLLRNFDSSWIGVGILEMIGRSRYPGLHIFIFPYNIQDDHTKFNTQKKDNAEILIF